MELTPVGGLVFFFDPLVTMRSAARCARLVSEAGSLVVANDILLADGMRTELAYETDGAAAQTPTGPKVERCGSSADSPQQGR